MADAFSAFEKLMKFHDYFGKAKDAADGLDKVIKAAKIDPKDPKQLKAMVGITDKETERLLKILGSRARATEAAAKARFPHVPSETTAAWAKWFKAADKSGWDSKEEYKARQAYLKALLAYDLALRERITYCQILVKTSARQEKLYKDMVAYHKRTQKILLGVIAAPITPSTAPQSLAMETLLKFEGVGGLATRIHHAHADIIGLAQVERKRCEKLKRINDHWISDVQAKNLRGLVKDAMSALGLGA